LVKSRKKKLLDFDQWVEDTVCIPLGADPGPIVLPVADALPIMAGAKRVCVVTVTNEKVIDTKRSSVGLAKHLARHRKNSRTIVSRPA
jgi:hypothetical protein